MNGLLRCFWIWLKNKCCLVINVRVERGRPGAILVVVSPNLVMIIDGLIDGRTDGLDSRRRLLETREESLEYRMGQVETALFADFSRLDTLLGGMQVTSDFLAQQLQLLPNFSNNN